MLTDSNAVATLPVKDLNAARTFYEGMLGLTPVGSVGDELIVYRTGKTTLNVYRSDQAGTNKATAVTWVVGEKMDEMVRTLVARGVAFEHYDMRGLERKGDVHVSGDKKTAWFKDPDGNILNLATR